MTLSYLNSFLGARIRLIQIWNGGVFRLPARRPDSTSSPVLNELGALAQLVEHLHGMQGVSGSNPLRSTILRILLGMDGFFRTETG